MAEKKHIYEIEAQLFNQPSSRDPKEYGPIITTELASDYINLEKAEQAVSRKIVSRNLHKKWDFFTITNIHTAVH